MTGLQQVDQVLTRTHLLLAGRCFERSDPRIVVSVLVE